MLSHVQKESSRGRYYLSARTLAELESYILDQFAAGKCNMCQKLCVQVITSYFTLHSHHIHSRSIVSCRSHGFMLSFEFCPCDYRRSYTIGSAGCVTFSFGEPVCVCLCVCVCVCVCPRDRDVTCVARRCTSHVLLNCLLTSRRRAVRSTTVVRRGPYNDRHSLTVSAHSNSPCAQPAVYSYNNRAFSSR